ncbi:BQ5605_C003g01856 [Microbotryum silenes-dioicae]|uniref:BQ5605_C003g01856 protein n=1 Tax=Microbotryum silenes-dioicae TaxID=796604 RepID=A0A2X0NXD2_9BASI|nr:BQ5605_C003g01856 [Microbotryum silenes-dioicae]
MQHAVSESVPICAKTNACPVVANVVSICNSFGACGFTCNGVLQKSGGACACDPTQCLRGARATLICNTSRVCDLLCDAGFSKVNGVCTPTPCVPSQYPQANNARSICSHDRCNFQCSAGFSKVDGKCTTVFNPAKVPRGARATPICIAPGACNLLCCNSGFTKVDGQCVRPPCDPYQNPSIAYGTAICSRDKCDVQCNDGFRKSNGACVSEATVASVQACAAYCLLRSCASFAFYDGNQCRIQLESGGFERFRFVGEVVHGIPGQCADLAKNVPIRAAKQGCTNLQVW